MTRFRLALPAEADLAHILAASAEKWGEDGLRRYAALLAAAMRVIAADPKGPLTRSRREIRSGLRSFHIRHARQDDPWDKVQRPVHVVHYRTIRTGPVEILRVLHERMEPGRHLEAPDRE